MRYLVVICCVCGCCVVWYRGNCGIFVLFCVLSFVMNWV